MALKQIARSLIPPILLDFRIALINFFINRKTIGEAPFRKWWDSHKNSDKIPTDLKNMTIYFLQTKESRLMSKYWWFLAKRNIEQIQNEGYENFKQTVARNYYTWVGGDGELLMSEVFKNMEGILNAADSLNVNAKEIFRLHSHFSTKESIDFNINTILFYLYVQKMSADGNSLIEEPVEGNPPGIYIKNKLITQDLLNSFLDYKSISSCCDLQEAKCVLELGAGYGRTAYYLIHKHPHLSYLVVDIPPALYIAQRYLTEQFPEKGVIKFNKDLDRDELKRAIREKAIIFLTPDQLQLLDTKEVDLFVAIDNLHAMSVQQVEDYFEQINRIAKLLYFTYWPGMGIPFDDFSYDSSKWPVRTAWKIIHESRTQIPSCYVNICYQING